MKHLRAAKKAMGTNKYIKVSPKAHSVSFVIQDGPIKEVKENGCQAVDILEFTQHLFADLNKAFPCAENEKTVMHIKHAIEWQTIRTANREKRGVEGKSEA